MDMLNHVRVGVVLRTNDAAATCLDCNATLAGWVGATVESMVGRSCLEWIPPIARPSAEKSVQRTVAGDMTSRVGRIMAADGSAIRVLILPRMVTLDDGNPGALVALIRADDMEGADYIGGASEAGVQSRIAALTAELQVLGVSVSETPVLPWSAKQLLALSTRERQVLIEMQRGGKAADIGRTLGISASIVRGHTQAISEKLGVANRAALQRLLLGD